MIFGVASSAIAVPPTSPYTPIPVKLSLTNTTCPYLSATAEAAPVAKRVCSRVPVDNRRLLYPFPTSRGGRPTNKSVKVEVEKANDFWGTIALGVPAGANTFGTVAIRFRPFGLPTDVSSALQLKAVEPPRRFGFDPGRPGNIFIATISSADSAFLPGGAGTGTLRIVLANEKETTAKFVGATPNSTQDIAQLTINGTLYREYPVPAADPDRLVETSDTCYEQWSISGTGTRMDPVTDALPTNAEHHFAKIYP